MKIEEVKSLKDNGGRIEDIRKRGENLASYLLSLDKLIRKVPGV